MINWKLYSPSGSLLINTLITAMTTITKPTMPNRPTTIAPDAVNQPQQAGRPLTSRWDCFEGDEFLGFSEEAIGEEKEVE
jgi:hypothetical protein